MSRSPELLLTSNFVNEDSAAVLIAVDQDVDDVRVLHRVLLGVGLEAIQEGAVLLLELEHSLDLQSMKNNELRNCLMVGQDYEIEREGPPRAGQPAIRAPSHNLTSAAPPATPTSRA